MGRNTNIPAGIAGLVVAAIPFVVIGALISIVLAPVTGLVSSVIGYLSFIGGLLIGDYKPSGLK